MAYSLTTTRLEELALNRIDDGDVQELLAYITDLQRRNAELAHMFDRLSNIRETHPERRIAKAVDYLRALRKHEYLDIDHLLAILTDGDT